MYSYATGSDWRFLSRDSQICVVGRLPLCHGSVWMGKKKACEEPMEGAIVVTTSIASQICP